MASEPLPLRAGSDCQLRDPVAHINRERPPQKAIATVTDLSGADMARALRPVVRFTHYTTTDVRIAGSYVAAQSSSGGDVFDSCSNYGDSRTCPMPRYWLRVIDSRSRRHVDLTRDPPDPDVPDATAIALSGQVAWLDLRSPPQDYVLEATSLHPLAGRVSPHPRLPLTPEPSTHVRFDSLTGLCIGSVTAIRTTRPWDSQVARTRNSAQDRFQP
jgi:hypothetical protein